MKFTVASHMTIGTEGKAQKLSPGQVVDVSSEMGKRYPDIFRPVAEESAKGNKDGKDVKGK